MGITFDGSANMFCDSNAKSTSIRPELTLNHKHSSADYHRVREAQYGSIIRIDKEYTRTDLLDML